ncbi:dihydrofolate reductase [Halanaerobium hydrogeniformans]|uniref:Dihydrofolate reductase n=1 Tax=Halanaerobium hydrogeniformans TaxID=656519 RepID=E4RKF6_HALHG|nr:dihydrofolate reductase [Halanaerobium hydrogeniformans]ADQ14665.1 Dihydrofolate reductase [Halanaerobium hydrogeniformans]
MSLSIIAAMDQNQLIGQNGKLPWKLPADLRYFKQTTMGSAIIMGRKTFESIGSPLAGRKNIILSKNKNYSAEGCEIIHSKKEILNRFLVQKKEAFIIGGLKIFQLFLPYCDKLYLTIIEHEFSGDTYFPEIDFDNWIKIQVKKGVTDCENPYEYYHNIYLRKKGK